MLDALGISASAARVYTELVAAGLASSSDIAGRCGLSTRAAGTELHQLATLGLAFRLEGRPVRYRPIAPDLALGTLLSRREDELRQVPSAMRQLTETFLQTARARHPDAQVEVVQGAANISRVATALHEQARQEVKGFDRAPYTRPPGTHGALENRRMKDGVTYRVIYDRAALTIPDRMAADILPSIEAGEHARSSPELPIKLLIGDDQIGLIPAAITSRAIDTTFVIHRSPILTAMIALFEAEWARATPVLASRSPGGPDEQTAVLVGMLASGMTDEAIARSLGWSVRTTQRRMAGLLAALGATTRFQAGVAARDRGWL
jgi:hypothetical protein